MKAFSYLILSFIFSIHSVECKTVRALFIGNSYTDVNNLPEIVKQIALSTGDTLIYSKNAPGGYTFLMHTTNATTISLIQAGNWDYVILQEQSQLPSFPDNDVATQVYPYAAALDSMIKASSPCATTLFYMTWGRQNGDAANCPFFPPLCTYLGMDSLLQLRYTIMAQDNHAAISPVAKVWRKIRSDFPTLNLYASDGSHPNNNGSFAAACSFYSVMFGKNPQLASYNFTVTASDAVTIKTVAKEVAFDSLNYWFQYDALIADFNFSTVTNTVSFFNTSQNATTFNWTFGDGSSSTLMNPSHTYTASGTFNITLIASDSVCGFADTVSKTITISTSGLAAPESSNSINILPNPVLDVMTFTSVKTVSSFQIFTTDGRLILTSNRPIQSNEEHSLNVSMLSSGIYFLKVYSDELNASCIKFTKF
ncbi:MAG: T9SS type A sorting domain-containing protein [Bacteroidota bacterium]|nr:MAG: T9SS type A sorting domain-containing protein [Bacteroidota bacterium]